MNEKEGQWRGAIIPVSSLSSSPSDRRISVARHFPAPLNAFFQDTKCNDEVDRGLHRQATFRPRHPTNQKFCSISIFVGPQSETTVGHVNLWRPIGGLHSGGESTNHSWGGALVRETQAKYKRREWPGCRYPAGGAASK